MRDYAKVSGQFWTGKTGKSLRGDQEAQLLALYLMTSPHSNMIGVFHCPVLYMAHETGLTIEGASKALQRLIEGEFCAFDGDDEVVWVREMAAHQIGEGLSPKDKQCAGVRKQYAQISQTAIRKGFYARYAKDFHLDPVVIPTTENPSPFEAPSKPLRSQEQEQEQEQEEKQLPAAESVAGNAPPAATPKLEIVNRNPNEGGPHDQAPERRSGPSRKGSRLPDDWRLPKAWGEWAASELGLQTEVIRREGEKFADFWRAKAGKDAAKLDWLATWRNWARTVAERAAPSGQRAPSPSALFAGAI